MNNKWEKIFIRRDSDVPTICGMILTASKYLWEFKKNKKEYLFGYSKDGHYNYFGKNFDRYEFGRHLYKEYFNSPADILNSYRKGKYFLATSRVISAFWQKQLKKHFDPEILLAVFLHFKQEFEFVNDNYSIMPWWATEAWQHDFEKILLRLVQRHKLTGQYDQIISAVTKPWKQTAIAQIRKDHKHGISIPGLVKKYQFLRSWTAIWYKPIDNKWIKTALSVKVTAKSPTLSFQGALRLLQPSKAEKKYFYTAPYMVFFKDWRDDLRRQHAYRWQFLWQALGNYFHVKPSDIGYFTFTELEQALSTGKFNHLLISERKAKPFLILVDKPRLDIKILTRGFPLVYNEVYKQDQRMLNYKEVHGIIGQPGLVIGKIKIIQGVKDLYKVKTGDILVANTTHPNYLLAMKKAKAFITDEGGIASHAAIVARELNIPCIVGTKIATKIFKNGDTVKVDANKGIVTNYQIN